MPDEQRSAEETQGLPISEASVEAVPGNVIAGRYRLLDRIGSGAMAEVFRARDLTLERDVAVKVFRTVMDGGDTAGNVRRELELQALARLSHPNLITLFDGSVTDDDTSFLALELVEGPTLAAVLCHGALPEAQARRIGTQIADALAYVHQQGMVHRDVKPANILLGHDSAADPTSFRARLSDFGIVRLVDTAEPIAADLTVGTAYYLAPEQTRSAAVGPPADVYALGLLLLETLTGARPFEGATHEVVVARLNRDPDIPADLPAPWPRLLRAMTAHDPAARPGTAEVARTLREADAADPAWPAADGAVAAAPLAGLPAATPRPRPAPATGAAAARRAPQHLTGMLLAAALFLIIVGGAGWFVFSPTADSGPPAPGQVASQVAGKGPVSRQTPERGTSPVTGAGQANPVVAHRAAGAGQAFGPALGRPVARVAPAAPQPTRAASRATGTRTAAPSSAAPSTTAAAPSGPPTTVVPTSPSAPASGSGSTSPTAPQPTPPSTATSTAPSTPSPTPTAPVAPASGPASPAGTATARLLAA